MQTQGSQCDQIYSNNLEDNLEIFSITLSEYPQICCRIGECMYPGRLSGMCAQSATKDKGKERVQCVPGKLQDCSLLPVYYRN